MNYKAAIPFPCFSCYATEKKKTILSIMDNRSQAAKDALSSELEQLNIGNPAIVDWETEDEEDTETSPKPEVITILFERKVPESQSKLSNSQSLLTMSLLRSKEKGQGFDESPSAIRRSMIVEEDKHSHEGEIRQHMVREREGNANPYLQRYIRARKNPVAVSR